MRSTVISMTAAVLALALGGCGGAANNTNTTANTSTNTSRIVPSPAPTVDCKNANMSREEYEKNKARCESEKGSSTIGQGIDDSWIWFKTRAALMTASDLRESTINVDVVNAMITLKGTVANAAQKASAEKVAKGIEGQKGVKNELKIAPNDSVTNMSSGNTKSGNTKSNSAPKK
jgi:hyperosmotically inducible protein